MAGRPFRQATMLRLEDGEWFEELLDLVGDGDSLAKVCREGGMSFGVVFQWIYGDEVRKGRYEEALRSRAEKVHEECLEIADGSGDPRLRVEERRKSAKVWNAERYGERGVVKELPMVVFQIGDLRGVGGVREEKVVEQVVEVAGVVEKLGDGPSG